MFGQGTPPVRRTIQDVLVRRADNDDPVTQEREALAEQHRALEELKRQLAERVAAVKEREEELRSAISRVAAGKAPGVALPPVVDPDAERLATRAAVLAERERALAAREAALGSTGVEGARSGNGTTQALREREIELQARARELEARIADLDARERAVEERERAPVDPLDARLAEIDTRLDELRAAEEAFLRTRRELAAHSDAITAREQLLAQREREHDEREDGWGSADVRELETRLRRLETQRTVSSQGFSGGFKKLEQDGTRRPPAS
jgi:DNA repair exonuclease SbcCD ATPase subunit